MKKQITRFSLILIMGLVGLVSKAQTVTIDQIWYELNDETETASVISIDNSYEGNLIIPSKIFCNGRYYFVTSIGKNAFSQCYSITSVNIPTSVTFIDEDAFYYCSSLTSITIPNSITTISKGVFRDCKELTSVIIPNSVTTIREDAFKGCYSLSSITIPGSVTSIMADAFNSSGLKSIVFEDNPTPISLGSNIFSYCHFDNVYLGRDLIYSTTYEDGYSPFYYKDVNYVTIGKNVTELGEMLFYACNIKSLEIPQSVTSIKTYAFYNNDKLTSVTIPKSVMTIDDSAFYGCGLTSVRFEDCSIPISLEKDVFHRCPLQEVYIGRNINFTDDYSGFPFYDKETLTSVTIGEQVTELGDYLFCYCCNLVSVEIPNSVTSIGCSTFSYCNGLQSIKLSNSLTEIKSCAFSSCSNLTSINIPNTVTSLGDGAFSGCSSLVSVNIPNSITTINPWLFSECHGLTSINIPNSVTSIGVNAFYNCSSLTSAIIPNSVTSIGEYSFSDCYSLTSAIIPNSVTEIGEKAFSHCYKLTSIDIPNSVKVIGGLTFNDCSSLTSITFMDSSESISLGDNVFSSCPIEKIYLGRDLTYKSYHDIYYEVYSPFYNSTTLSSITLGNKVTELGSYLFAKCSGLTSIRIPESVTKIGDSAFSYCNSLTEVTIPNSVTSISNNAFARCNCLTSVNIPNSVTSIGNGAFCGCSSLTSVNIPNSVTSIGWDAFLDCSGLTSVYYAAEEPIECGLDTFSDETYGNATLYVPEKAIAKCKEIDPWKNFGHIVACDFSGIDEVSADFDANASYEVFTFNGVKVSESLEGLAKGVYIVRQGNKIIKVAI